MSTENRPTGLCGRQTILVFAERDTFREGKNVSPGHRLRFWFYRRPSSKHSALTLPPSARKPAVAAPLTTWQYPRFLLGLLLWGRHHGRDIDGACGQLAVKVVTAGAKSGDGCSSGGGGNSGGDIEDLVAGASKRANGNLSRTGRKGLRGTAGERSPSSSRRKLVDAVFPDGGGGRLAALSLLVVGSTAVALAVAARARRRG